jgi:hypothetical protein
VLWTDNNDGGERIDLVPRIDISSDGNYVAAVVNAFDVNSAKSHIWVYLYNKNGQRLWKYDILSETPQRADNYIAISGNGNLITAGTSSGRIVILDHDGKLLWEFKDKEKDPVIVSIAASQDGSVFVIYGGNNVHFISTEGSISNRTISMAEAVWTEEVSVSHDGSKIAIMGPDLLYCFDKTGNLIWKQSIRRANTGYPASSMSSDGSLVAATNGHDIYLFDSTGKNIGTEMNRGRIVAQKLSGNGKYLIVSVDNDPEAFIEYYSIDVGIPAQKQLSSEQSPVEKGPITANGTWTSGFNLIATILGLIIVIFLIKNR